MCRTRNNTCNVIVLNYWKYTKVQHQLKNIFYTNWFSWLSKLMIFFFFVAPAEEYNIINMYYHTMKLNKSVIFLYIYIFVYGTCILYVPTPNVLTSNLSNSIFSIPFYEYLEKLSVKFRKYLWNFFLSFHVSS